MMSKKNLDQCAKDSNVCILGITRLIKMNVGMEVSLFIFSTYRVRKKKRYCNRMIEKKKSPFDECLCFVCLRTQNKQK